ncbi:hypothetical protein [Luteibacter aegosomatissinici]|uniref:hypothetical protein n=1 Tax=Luteibacter aegosomatissinici TaxID=2911539 RepID=UPI001FF9F55D|nr:hypothetical protein [Luteibacter aegosomatissinici]UPG92688.1 hypothetical protein L2Y97_12510 [Luteibacter aegosomatissinici]
MIVVPPRHAFPGIVMEVQSHPAPYKGDVRETFLQFVASHAGLFSTVFAFTVMVACVSFARRWRSDFSQWLNGLVLVGVGIVGSIFVYIGGDVRIQEQLEGAKNVYLIVAGVGANLIAGIPARPGEGPPGQPTGLTFFSVLGVGFLITAVVVLAALIAGAG